jgi:hypothetical protein
VALPQGCEDWQQILVASLLSLHRLLSPQRLYGLFAQLAVA